MRTICTLLFVASAALASTLAEAVDINGAWAAGTSVCDKVFEKKGNNISFTPTAELYGGGFIVEGNRVRGTLQKCKIKSMTDDGTNLHLSAACSTGVMVTQLEFILKPVGADRVTIGAAGRPDPVETSYVRCAL